ncbi:MAG: transketolase [Rhodospirillaceae bacterium]|jgi:transketolase|nr:transketolase [Rhodospirillaceae bacterium]MBT3627654.1 transketolase [Rhodospirillaceae bacterium]MBT4428871.1 transketolase [Rhodospirillaceae bacterium]MBT5037287.1 transketolase [Rhodospirillaceae bacterium]MBT6828214.1 transketolase [Rhodospirillaceae bacterium]
MLLKNSPAPLDARSKELRRSVLRMMQGADRGHIGAAFSLIEIMRVLYDDILNFRSDEPEWQDRDRCILSKGHGCLALYAILADKKYFPDDELDKFCAFDGILGGHPDAGKVPGVEASTGALGHGLSIGIGMALAARMAGSARRVYVVTGDGEINEGSIWEGAMSAAKHGLDNLTVLVDYNKLQSYGPTREVLDLEPLLDKWSAFGFAAEEVDGHDVDALRTLLQPKPFAPRRPLAIICHTVKGKGISFAEGNPAWHHQSRIGDEGFKELYDALETA